MNFPKEKIKDINDVLLDINLPVTSEMFHEKVQFYGLLCSYGQDKTQKRYGIQYADMYFQAERKIYNETISVISDGCNKMVVCSKRPSSIYSHLNSIPLDKSLDRCFKSRMGVLLIHRSGECECGMTVKLTFTSATKNYYCRVKILPRTKNFPKEKLAFLSPWTTSLHYLNNQGSCQSLQLQNTKKEILQLVMKNIQFTASFLYGVSNKWADALSRSTSLPWDVTKRQKAF